MEMRNEKGNEKRRRKIIQKNAVLVRSVRANQSSTWFGKKNIQQRTRSGKIKLKL